MPWRSVSGLNLPRCAPAKGRQACATRGIFFLGVRKGSIWDSLLLKGGKKSQGSFLEKMGRGNLPRAQTAMYLWGKLSQFGYILRKIISYVPGKIGKCTREVQDVPFTFPSPFNFLPHQTTFLPIYLMVTTVTRAVRNWMVPLYNIDLILINKLAHFYILTLEMNRSLRGVK